MERKQFTVEAVLWTYSKTKKGLHPVKVKVTYNRRSKYYPVQVDGKNVYLGEAQWRNINEKSVRKANKRIREAIEDSKSKARETIQSITGNKRAFTFERFEKDFILNTSTRGFIKFFEDYLDVQMSEGRIGSYHTYHCALQAFKAFRNNRDLDPLDITPDLLKGFETYLRKAKPYVTTRGKKRIRKAGKTTVSIYMRAVRAVYNYVSGKLPYLKEHYPFTTNNSERTKYKIKSGSGSKGDALTVEELRKFIDIEVLLTSPEWRAKHLWLFSFYCNGMNFNDIARLQYGDIKGNRIVYVRQKTKETEAKEEVLEIPLNDPIREILVDLGCPEKRKSDFVFDILTKGLGPFEQRVVVNQKLKIVNKWLKRMCSANDLPAITTYWARHTYASLLKQSGESIELIRELLGHSDIKTTESYLKRFDLDKKREANERIRSFMRKSV
jgi:integrase/recombinase XerD